MPGYKKIINLPVKHSFFMAASLAFYKDICLNIKKRDDYC